ncbi:MAG: tetratricopeptide repeat protein, partial [Planctomycetaceae bacterium]|nr:tetratricopeptide repeat protein [Planctomycetaceae bacterium]
MKVRITVLLLIALATVAVVSVWWRSAIVPPSGSDITGEPEPTTSTLGTRPVADGGESGHLRMLRILNNVRQRGRYEETFFGPNSIESAEAALAGRQPEASQHITQLFRLAEWRLWRGDTERALEHLQAARVLFESLPQPSDQMGEELWFRLGLASLRLGENENCVNCNNGASCLLPIAAAGIHQNQEGSRAAVGYLTRVLEHNPDHLTARWLLNIAHMTLGEYPDGVPERFRVDPTLFESQAEFPRFPNIAIPLGLNTVSLSGGSVVDDFDGDNDLDVVTSSWGEGDTLQFFRNTDGLFHREDEAANFTGLFGGLNLLQADYDNDGDL